MFAQHAIACVLCELLCLELFYVFFQHENRFRYKFFDIVQFSRSCWTWIILNISVSAGVFERLLVLFKGFVLRLQKSFFCLSAWRSHIVPHLRGFGKPFFKVFFAFFAFVYKNQFFAPDLPGFRAGLPILSYYKRAAVQALNRSLSSRQTKKQNVFSRISEMRSWFSFMQLPASCGSP